MYERLYRLYRDGKISESELQKAVAKGWITEEQYESIVSQDPNATTEDFENALTEMGVK